MSEKQTNDRKLFTIEQANAMLPLVRAIVEDLSVLSRDVVERRERIWMLRDERDRDSTDPYSEELVQIEEDLDKDSRRQQRRRLQGDFHARARADARSMGIDGAEEDAAVLLDQEDDTLLLRTRCRIRRASTTDSQCWRRRSA